MNDLLVIAAHNSVAALVLSVLVYGLTRLWRNPPVAHVLWLVVLLKLVSPPIMRLDWPRAGLPELTRASGQLVTKLPRIEEPKSEHGLLFFDRPAARTGEQVPATGVRNDHVGGAVHGFWGHRQPLLPWLWLAGSALCAVVATTRIVRFERRLRDALPGSERLHRLTVIVAGQIGVRRVPDVRYLVSIDVPLVWWAGRRPTIVLPMRLAAQLDDERLSLILAHELAHLRRRDYWVRAVELLISTIYWWNPLVWFIRRQIHEAEDLCCDGWVRWAFPDCKKCYAEVLLKTAESLGRPPVATGLLPASPLLRSLPLKARIQMILEDRFAPYVPARSLLFVVPFVLVVLASFVQSTKTEARAGSNEEAAAAATPDASVPTDFPHVVKFEQGATRFLDGDSIKILEVRGTAETFMPGNSYQIRGTYTLASHDAATLAAYITATEAGYGRCASLKVQSTVVQRGDGTFTLVLPMAYRGWPHVSFYPAEGGNGFGGNYFGTGDCVRKRWRGAKDDQATAGLASTPDASVPADFPHVVKFEQGATRFLNGDGIKILEVRGTAETFTPGKCYLIRGEYTLKSHGRATLAAYITAMDAENGSNTPLRIQSTVVDNGKGTFTLVLPMAYRGWPHVSFYPADGGEGFGGTYFGTGDNVYR
jgi:beta-lactamase regulating signal transducer with metallopeptidase domain